MIRGGSPHVACGSFATEMGIPRDVRFIPDSDRTADIIGGPVGAINRRRATEAFSRLIRHGKAGKSLDLTSVRGSSGEWRFR